MDAYDVMVAHERMRNTHLSLAHSAFFYRKVRQRGLTKLLADRFGLPKHSESQCGACAARDSAKYQRYMAKTTSSGKVGALYQSRKRRQRNGDELAATELIVIDKASAPVESGDYDMAAAAEAASRKLQCFGGSDARLHGIYVDNDVQAYLRNGGSFRRCGREIDQCSMALVRYIEENLGFEMLAAQVPVYSSKFHLATALDVVAVDRATRSRFIVIEVKATRQRGEWASRCYSHTWGQCTWPGLERVYLSKYMLHQLQLWTQVRIMSRECGVRVDEAYVLRTSPDRVSCYPLHAGFDDIGEALEGLFVRRSSSAGAAQ